MLRPTLVLLTLLLAVGCAVAPDDDDSSTDDDDSAPWSDDDDSALPDDDDLQDDDDDDGAPDDDDSAPDDDDSAPDCPELPLSPLGLFDLAAIQDPGTLDLQVLSTTTVVETVPPLGLPVTVQVQEIRYTSTEVVGCDEYPITIEAWVAMPDDAVGQSASLPGLVVAHGLGGQADTGAASVPAAELDVVALAYSGPGQGSSEGDGSDPDHLFATVPDPRASWMWEHPVAAMRGLTVLEQLPEVDASRLGMTGYSGGGVATLVANGVDPRLVAAVPVSAAGHMDLAIAATPVPGWQADLLDAMTPPRTSSSPEWLAYQEWLDPKNFLATASGVTLLVDGAQDQFFPINSATQTLLDLQAAAPESRALIIKDWDHGWYALFDDGDAAEWTGQALAAWFARAFGTDAALAEAAPQPTVLYVADWLCPWSCALVVVDTVPGSYDVDEVEVHFSGDSALTFASWNLQDEDDGLWAAEVGTWDPAVHPPGSIPYFAEVTYRAGLLGPTFKVTTVPSLPAGFSPNIIPIDGPLP